MIRKTVWSLLIAGLALGHPLPGAASGSPEPSAVLSAAIARLDRDASADAEAPMVLAKLLQKEFGTRGEELQWAIDRNMSWGEIAALAYIQATTGKSFAQIDQEDARRNFWAYADNAGMSREKMAHWLGEFQKRAERERNSRIFDRLRASRKVHPLPDVGSGFGLLQEALDFRRLDTPRPTKIHDMPGELAKGEK
jgi:hypothetical protein